ncbi:phosphoglycerate mutase family protein [Streptomyces sp. NBC_01260]|uniref:histidine phosphatase family protein n=1 Tax=unclassified Streptomyces TaxID=2593676 RepID=UPI001F1533A8|nr:MULTISPECIES: histidine phosphatase family protein [unclassified Streptomyces]MCX4771353.1 phosphoglycerate mutase family protein [Streptomyces sp. NBC_01285]
MGELILIRHGQTEWGLSGQHAGRTDVPLTDAGEAAAKALAPRPAQRHLAAVPSSPLTRAMRTGPAGGTHICQARSRSGGVGLRRGRTHRRGVGPHPATAGRR